MTMRNADEGEGGHGHGHGSGHGARAALPPPPVGRGGHMSRWLAREWRETLLGQSAALQKRDDLHRLAEANRAYTHYKWW